MTSAERDQQIKSAVACRRWLHHIMKSHSHFCPECEKIWLHDTTVHDRNGRLIPQPCHLDHATICSRCNGGAPRMPRRSQ